VAKFRETKQAVSILLTRGLLRYSVVKVLAVQSCGVGYQDGFVWVPVAVDSQTSVGESAQGWGRVRFFVQMQRWVTGGLRRLVEEPRVIPCVQDHAPCPDVQVAAVPASALGV